MKTKITIILLLPIFFIACSGGQDNTAYAPEMEEMSVGFVEDDGVVLSKLKKTLTVTDATTTNQIKNDKKIEKKIIKTANLSIEVEEYKESRKSLSALLKKYDAYIANEEEYNRDYQMSTSLVIRISSENFDTLLNEICGLAVHIDSKTINSKDVTEEFIDITARLKNKREVEQQYLEILKKAYTIKDILQVNEHLRVIREEIESKEGRLKYLSNQVSFSTINVNLYQQIEQAYVGFFSQLLDGFEGGWKGILMFIIGLAYMWPFLLFVAFVIWLIIRYRKKRRQKKNN
jgi:multidrug efflux pump subunit AcrB